ncbi:hypothetical protein AX15_005895 [Amanita polypyramis BW_CC]|nr:hypothetical protein AX15_005895 [Amanita polypyramis BW_CC]
MSENLFSGSPSGNEVSSEHLVSPTEESEAHLSPEVEPERSPEPGINGTPVRWYDANRTEPYTKIIPFQEKRDTSVEFFYKPLTLSALSIGLIILAYVAMTQDVLEEGHDKRRIGLYAAIASFLLFSMIQFRDGPFIRPHPAFWRIVLGINLLYELALAFLLFQDLGTARHMMTLLDVNLGKPLPEKNYAEDCSLSVKALWNALDIFCVAHTLGWFGKAMILRDYWFCWILSVAFELAEYSLQHQLPNFAECWWDHWILDVLFSPHDFTAFEWGTAISFRNYISVVLLLAMFLAAELNPFYLKSLLWLEPDHPIVITRLVGIFLCALPAVRELYQYVHDPRRAVRMGQHVWLLTATIVTELLVITKWSRGVFTTPTPRSVRLGLTAGAILLMLYPIIQFGLPAIRRYIRNHQKRMNWKSR